ncbi:MAG: TlpA disulfide reductase family protein [Kofleriaceae bacterium]
MTTEPTDVDPVRAPLRVPLPPPSTGSTKALIGILLAGTAGMVIFLFVHLSNDGGIRPGPASAHAECSKGERDCLPDVNYTDTDGVAYTHASLAGKVVLVNFWATWCHPCQKEIPDLSRVYDKYKAKGVVFLGVMTDTPDNQALLNFKSDFEMSYPIVRSNSDVMVSFNYPDALPTTFVYDRGGKQIYNHVGPLRERELDSLLAQLSAQP